MKPPEISTMGAWASHILEQHSLQGDEASKLLTQGFVHKDKFEALMRRVQHLEEKQMSLPDIEGVDTEEDIRQTLIDVDLASLSLAELRRWGEAYQMTARSKKGLLKGLQGHQDSLLGLEEE